MVEIRLPEAKPAFEWVNGRPLQKVSPKWRHAYAQGRFVSALGRWAQRSGSGVCGTEWRFRLQPPGEIRRPLVPDVAFISYRRLPYTTLRRIDEPTIAPDAVVEVRSPGDRQRDLDDKIRVYLATGASVVFLVDPSAREVEVCDARGRSRLEAEGILKHDALPGFRLKVNTLFDLPRPRSARTFKKK